MSVLLVVILVFAAMTLVVAVMQAVAIVRIAPAHENLAGFMPLGWWKFHQLADKAGPAAAQPLNIYKRAVIAFIVFLMLGLVLSGWTISRSAPQAAQAALNSFQPRDAVAQFAQVKDYRRAAIKPGTQSVES